MRNKLLFALSAICAFCLGQVETGSITGIVLDATGASVPDAQITITNLETGVARTIRADESGNYSSPPLRPGRYKIEAAKEGFRRSIEEDLLSVP